MPINHRSDVFRLVLTALVLGFGTASTPLEAEDVEQQRSESSRTKRDASGSAQPASASLQGVARNPAEVFRPRRVGTLFRWSSQPSVTGGPNLQEPLVTDRPDFTEASSTVGRGVVQLEFGYTFTFDEEGPSQLEAHSIGEPLLRYGILKDWLELRLGLFPVSQETTVRGTSETTAGTEDLNLGLKIGLTPQDGLRPEMALIPQMNLPTGSDAFSAEEVQPGLIWIYGWEINDFLVTAGQTQINRRLDRESYLEVSQSWTVGYSLTEKLGAYTEWFALFPHSAETAQTEHFFNGGFTYLISDDIQFDIRAGTGLNEEAADFFAGTGLSIRWR